MPDWGEEDWTDPDFLVGAVLAQVEEVSPAEAIKVLDAARAELLVYLERDKLHP
jgi:hypothetical protein